ncbi:MAG: hypothetical protein WCK11_05945, partial [Candidatus Falkowbacteria bacterium]
INNFNPANYQSEKIIINNQNRLYYINNFNGIKYKLVYTQNPESLKPNYQVDDDFKLNLDYWNILSAQAVGYSAGVIGYFQNRFNQIDKVKVQTKVGFWQGVGQGLGQLAQGAKYVIGDVASLGSIKRQEIWSGTTKLAAETWQEAINYGEAVGETTTKLAVATVETGQTVAKDTVEITGVIIDKSAEQGKMLSQKIITTLPPPPKLPKLPQLPKLVLIKPAKAVGPVTASVKPVAKLPATILPITTTSVTTNNPIAYYFSPTPSPTPNPELPAKEATSTIIDLATSTATSTMATSTEAVPLTAIITSLATTTPQNILISWQVNEASSTSSSTAFDLAYTINSGEWQTYLSSTTATSTVYGATKPTSTALTYSFKVRAGESGQWSESQSIVLAKTDTCTPLESLITNGAINLTSAESPYCLHQELDTSADQSITIEPGVVIRFARNIKWHINGTVQAIGALGLPIVFTALTDVPNSQPKKGDWCGLDFQPGSMANFEYAEFKYGGWCSDIAAMAKSKVVSRKSNIRLAAQQVWQMYAAIDANDATITISRSVFKDNDSAIWSHGQSTVTVSHSRFEQNSIAILNDKYAVNPVEATNNWWGTDLGPRTFELQNQLDWNLFLGDITYEPWQLTAPIN